MIDKQNNSNVEIVAHLGSFENCVLELRIPQPEQGYAFGRAFPEWDEPVCGQGTITVPVYGRIVANNNGSYPCAPAGEIAGWIGTANNLWSQCNIGFHLYSTNQLNKTSARDIGSWAELQSVCNNDRIAGGITVFAVCNLSGNVDACGIASGIPSSCAFIDVAPFDWAGACCANEGVTTAHELGHCLGLDHFDPDTYCYLMRSGISGSCNCSTISDGDCTIARATASSPNPPWA